MIKLLCYFSSSLGYENRGSATKPTLKIIRDPLQDVVLDGMENFEKDSWLFHFQFQLNYSDQLVHSSIRNYFSRFPNINLKSRIYVLSIMPNNLKLYEVYQKMKGMEITIAELCKLESNNELEKREIKNGNQLWSRRKNLTGVHLKVAYKPQHYYLYYETNNVSSIKTFIIVFNVFSNTQIEFVKNARIDLF